MAFLDFQRIVKEAVSSTCDPEKISEIFLAKFGLPAESDFYDESDEYYEYEQALGSCWPRDLPDRRDVLRRLFNALLALARAYYSDSAKNPRAIAACEFCDSPQVATPRKPSSAKPAANANSGAGGESSKRIAYNMAYRGTDPSRFQLIVKELLSRTIDPEKISETLLVKFGLPAQSKLYDKLDEYEQFERSLSFYASELPEGAHNLWSLLCDLAGKFFSEETSTAKAAARKPRSANLGAGGESWAYNDTEASQFLRIVQELVSGTSDPEKISETLLAKFGLPAQSKLYEKLDEYENFEGEVSYWAGNLPDLWSLFYDLAEEFFIQQFCKEVRTRAQRGYGPDKIVTKVAAILGMGCFSRGMNSLRQLLRDVARPSVDDLRPIWAEASAEIPWVSLPDLEMQPDGGAPSSLEPKETPPEPETPMNDAEATNFLGMTEIKS